MSDPRQSGSQAILPISRKLWFLGFVGLLPLLFPGLGILRPFLIFFLAPTVVDLLSWARRRPQEEESASALAELPLPGPAERGGERRFMLRYHLSTMLMLLNPLQLAQVVRQLRGETAAMRRVGGHSPQPGSYRQKVAYRLPFDGEWLVMNGGITPQSSHSWDLLSQRYAYDFVVADAKGRRHSGDGARKEHYFCYGQAVLAPADGEVVQVRDGVRDAPRVGTGWVDWLCQDFGGNSVTIRHAEGEYSHLAHLVPGSIEVRLGDRVHGGQQIARCGHSGHSTEPHLHFQLQDRADFYGAVGLPIAFSQCAVDGEPAREPEFLQRGMRVRRQSAGEPSQEQTGLAPR